MRAKPFVFLLLLWMPFLAEAQNTYVKTVGTADSDYGTSCAPTHNKGNILTVCGAGVTGNIQFGLVKTDHNGSIQWKKMFSFGTFALPQTVLQAADRGYLVFGTADNVATDYNALFLLKTDSFGNAEWARYLPVSANDRAVGMVRSQAGGYITCSVADYNSVNGQYAKALLMRFTENGDVLWKREFMCPFGLEPVSLLELPGGEIVFVSQAKYSLQDSFRHILLTKTDTQGTELWSSYFSLLYDDEPSDLAADAWGNLFVVGRTYRMGHEWDAFVLKVNPQGQRLFNRFYDAGTAMGEVFRNVAIQSNGTVYVSGDVGSFEERDISMLALDGSGQVKWAKRYPLSTQFTNYAMDMYASYNGGMVLTGDVRPPNYLRDAALVRTDSLGNVPCFNQNMVYTVDSEPFWESAQVLGDFSPVVVPPVEVAFTHPPEVISEKISCENPLPIVDFAGVPEVNCPNVCMDFMDSTLNHPTGWMWTFEGGQPATSTEQHPQNICYADSGMYTVTLTATNAYGSVTRNEKVLIENGCPIPEPQIPNVFSPNGDGVNDEFFIQQLPDVFRLTVYNRWGEEVFGATEPIGWKGKNKYGLPVTDGVYFYCLETEWKNYHGLIHVVR